MQWLYLHLSPKPHLPCFAKKLRTCFLPLPLFLRPDLLLLRLPPFFLAAIFLNQFGADSGAASAAAGYSMSHRLCQVPPHSKHVDPSSIAVITGIVAELEHFKAQPREFPSYAFINASLSSFHGDKCPSVYKQCSCKSIS